MRQHVNPDPHQRSDQRYTTSITWLRFFQWFSIAIGVNLILHLLFDFYALAILFLCIFAGWAYDSKFGLADIFKTSS